MTNSRYHVRPAALILLAVVLASLLAGRSLADDAKAAHRLAAPTLLNSPSDPLVALRIVIRAGSQNDPPGKEGLSALTAAMVAEGGTKSLTYDQLLEAFYPMAAFLGGACRKEVTVFSSTIHRDNLGAFVPLVTRMIREPRFAPEDFERLRNEALDYVTKTLRASNDEELGKWTLQTELYKDHPYGHPDLGTAQGLKAITLDDVKQFHRRHYTHEALKLGLGGGFGESNNPHAGIGVSQTTLRHPRCSPTPDSPSAAGHRRDDRREARGCDRYFAGISHRRDTQR